MHVTPALCIEQTPQASSKQGFINNDSISLRLTPWTESEVKPDSPGVRRRNWRTFRKLGVFLLRSGVSVEVCESALFFKGITLAVELTLEGQEEILSWWLGEGCIERNYEK